MASLLSMVAAMLLLSTSTTEAFFSSLPTVYDAAFGTYTNAVHHPAFNPLVLHSQRRNQVLLSMSGDEEPTAEVTDEENIVELEDDKEETKEDSEITALKEEIAVLEKELKSKRVEASRVQDLADDYTESGYVRKCAEMDNTKRLRSKASADSLITSRASILQNFLPTLDALQALDVTYADNDFAKGYSALRGNFENCLKELDVAEFTVEVGSKIDKMRCIAADEEFSETEEAGVVLRVEKVGYEVLGNIIRFAEVTVSLGIEKDVATFEEEEETVKEEE